MPRPLAVGLLIVTTLLWGLAFVFQKTAMDNIGPLGFSAVRYAIAAVVMIPLATWEYRRRRAPVSGAAWLNTVGLGLAFFAGVTLQQVGLTMTTVTNSGFLTGLYVLLVPLLGIVALRHMPHPVVWLSMPVALLGLYFLNGARLDAFNPGDLLVIACALAWSVQVLAVGFVARQTGLPITVSVACFAITALLSGAGAALFETFAPAMVGAVWVELLYASIFSTAIAFTLQAVGQQYVPPANAAIILSAESLVAALGGALVLGERLTPIGYTGAGLIFLAIVLVEAVPALRRRMATS